MQGSAIGEGMFCSLSLEHDPISYWSVLDKLSNFLLPVFIDEDEGVVFGISSIVFMPSFPRIYQLFVIADGNVGGCGEAFQEGLRSLVFDDV